MGCDLDDRSSSEEPSLMNSADENDRSTLVDDSSDAAEWANIRWHTATGPSGEGATRVMTLDANITDDGRFVQFGWDHYPWSGSGLGHFFVWDGSRWVGGKYEWIMAPKSRIGKPCFLAMPRNSLRASLTPSALVYFSISGSISAASNSLAFTRRGSSVSVL